MLAQKYRFHARGGVRFVFQKGKTIRTPILSLVYLPNNRGYRRVAVVVSKKILKLAVGRNRIRRRVYEAIRLELENYQSHMDYIFVVYSKSISTMSFLELRRMVKDLMDRTQIEYISENPSK